MVSYALTRYVSQTYHQMKQLIAVLFFSIALALLPQHSFSQERVQENDVLSQANGQNGNANEDTTENDEEENENGNNNGNNNNNNGENDTNENDENGEEAEEEEPTGRTVLEVPVRYTAQDSIVFFPRTRIGHLFGDAEIHYGDVRITAQYITTDMDAQEISATFGLDSLGQMFGLPVLSERGDEHEIRTLTYNFRTNRAHMAMLITQEGEGHIIAREAVMNPDRSFYMRNARYTTCPNHDNPHFYLHLTRAKVRPGEDVVTGPAWLVVADLPLFPIVLPFAFFPFTDTFSSGIIMPSYGQEMARGFFLQNGGYYFAINDFVDLAITGEIFTKGSWALAARSNYRVRYRFSGNVNVTYRSTAIGDRDLRHIIPGAFHRDNSFSFNWTHSQDPAHNMFRTLSASVNYATSSFRHNDLSQIATRQASNNTVGSSVNLTQRFPDAPWTLSANMQMNQITSTSTVSATLPRLSANMSRIHPFRRRNAIGAQRWFERITMSYSGEFANTITTQEDQFFRSHLINDWTNGIRHNIPVTATFSVFDFINITPSFNYTERWYSGGVRQAWNPITNRHEVVDTVRTFSRVWDYNVSVGASTRLYGMYVPLWNSRVEAIRHVFSPTISLSYRPDFGDPRFGSWRSYYFRNAFGDYEQHHYSPYAQMMFGTTSRGQSGSVGFDFRNNLEMRVRTQQGDTIGSRRVSLIDDLGISFNYNMMADSMRWSMINTNIRIRFSQAYTLSLNMVWDPYMLQLDHRGQPRRVDKLRIRHGRGFGRLQSTGTSFSYSLNQSTFDRLFARRRGENGYANGNGNGNGNGSPPGEPILDDGTIGRNPNETYVRPPGMGSGDLNFDGDGFLINPVNWNLSFNYSVRYSLMPMSLENFDERRGEIRGQLTHNLGFSGSIQPTVNWNLTFNADYNFDLGRITNLNASITRRMCCWSMSASFIPFGPMRMYMFTIRADASLLRDLKYDQRNVSRGRGTRWY